MTHPLLERGPLFQSQRVGLGNDRNDIDHVGKLLEHDNVDGFQATLTSANQSLTCHMTRTHECPDGWIKKRQQWIRVSCT